jgi:3-oxoacyl-[acyl-carrier-protein] synthase-3
LSADFHNLFIDTCVAAVSRTTLDVSSDELLGKQKGRKFSLVTGIESVSRFSSDIFFSDAAEKVGQVALVASEIAPSDLQLLIVCTQSADFSVPAIGAKIHKALELGQECNVVDINQGCNALPNLIAIAGSMMQSHKLENALILAGDLSSRHAAGADGTQPAIFGDAVSGIVMKRGPGSIFCQNKFFSTGYEEIFLRQSNSAGRYPGATAPLQLNGEAVYNFAVEAAEDIIRDTLRRKDLDIDDLSFVSLHQANKAINDAIKRKLSIPDNKLLSSLRRFGNTSSASIGLNIACNNVPIGLGLLCGFGVGLSCGAVLADLKNKIKTKLIEI